MAVKAVVADFEHSVFASRMNSCIRKSSRRPAAASEAIRVRAPATTPARPLQRVALEERSDWGREDLRERLGGNLCRCTGYQTIVDAVLTAQETLRRSREGDAQ